MPTHAQQCAALPAECSRTMGTEHARAKHLRRSGLTIRENRPLRASRLAAALILQGSLSMSKRLALASALGVSEILVRHWMNPAQSDRKPAPLAILVDLDAADFERVIAAIRAARADRGEL